MNANGNLYQLADELIEVLDEDIRHLEGSLERLDTLRAMTITRDETGLNELLETIRIQANRYSAVEQKRQQLRTQIAALLGSSFDDTDLSLIAKALAGEKSQAVKTRQDRLAELVGKMNVEHAATAMLLAECSRFNQQILNSILCTKSSEGTTYSRQGAKNENRTSGMMNMRL
ncbi:FlgN protein [Anaerohalosphaera lusitana]|uniref:FlgN protein n=1 Tax=Anaerohalosphaera lusitana TaxID=1936003 RepID=A0A1U9NHD4_9BACT|nr:flagellar export chaperone FlgN [Anaerohalosphaera lusitana]AQT66916.1 FlgN protein [Anaerohalosphaera lusitana]